MSPAPKVLVTGAGGRTGKQVVKALRSRGADVRAMVRREEAARELTGLGVPETVLADFEDIDSLGAATDGCSEAVHICPPMHPDETLFARRMADLCRDAGVGRLILYSVLHPLLEDVFHHNNKLEAERYLVNSGLTYTILQPARYMQHLVPIWDKVLESGIHDMPFSTRVPFNVVDLRDLAEAAAIVATEPGHENATYQLAGPEALSQEDMAAIISRIAGTEIRAEAKPETDFRRAAEAAGMTPDRLEKMTIMNRHYDKHGMTGNPNVLRWILGRRPATFEEFIRRDLWRDPTADQTGDD